MAEVNSHTNYKNKMTKEEIEALAKAFATASGHLDPKGFSEAVFSVYDLPIEITQQHSIGVTPIDVVIAPPSQPITTSAPNKIVIDTAPVEPITDVTEPIGEPIPETIDTQPVDTGV